MRLLRQVIQQAQVLKQAVLSLADIHSKTSWRISCCEWKYERK